MCPCCIWSSGVHVECDGSATLPLRSSLASFFHLCVYTLHTCASESFCVCVRKLRELDFSNIWCDYTAVHYLGWVIHRKCQCCACESLHVRIYHPSSMSQIGRCCIFPGKGVLCVKGYTHWCVWVVNSLYVNWNIQVAKRNKCRCVYTKRKGSPNCVSVKMMCIICSDLHSHHLSTYCMLLYRHYNEGWVWGRGLTLHLEFTLEYGVCDWCLYPQRSRVKACVTFVFQIHFVSVGQHPSAKLGLNPSYHPWFNTSFDLVRVLGFYKGMGNLVDVIKLYFF